MTDENEIKEVVIGELDRITQTLQNGGAKSIEDIGRALGYLLHVIRPMIKRQTVMESECRERMCIVGQRLEHHAETCAAAKLISNPAEAPGVIFAKLASTSLPWLILIVGVLVWAWFK